MTMAKNRMTNEIRLAYFAAILRQDVGYFDVNSPGELNTRLFEDVKKISRGIGEKTSISLQSFIQFFGGRKSSTFPKVVALLLDFRRVCVKTAGYEENKMTIYPPTHNPRT